MLRVILFDLGDTLVKNGAPLPFVRDVLPLINRFQTEAGAPLQSAIVSDFTMPAAPATDEKIAPLFQEYVSLLENFGLRQYFDPVQKRITLSSHVGVHKPDRRVFEKTLERMGVAAPFADCLFITENAAHIQAAKLLGFESLEFGAAPPLGFTDWRDGVMMIASRCNDASLEMALRFRLQADQQLTLVSWQRTSATTLSAKVRQMHAFMDAALGALAGVQAEILTTATIRLGLGGYIESVDVNPPTDEALDDTKTLMQSLVTNKQVATEGDASVGGKTHQVVIDDKGRKVLKRRGFSII